MYLIEEFENVKFASESPTNKADEPQKLCSTVEFVIITIMKNHDPINGELGEMLFRMVEFVISEAPLVNSKSGTAPLDNWILFSIVLLKYPKIDVLKPRIDVPSTELFAIVVFAIITVTLQKDIRGKSYDIWFS